MFYNLPLVATCKWKGTKSYNTLAYNVWIDMVNFIGSPKNSWAIKYLGENTVEVDDAVITPEFEQKFSKYKKGV